MWLLKHKYININRAIYTLDLLLVIRALLIIDSIVFSMLFTKNLYLFKI